MNEITKVRILVLKTQYRKCFAFVLSLISIFLFSRCGVPESSDVVKAKEMLSGQWTSSGEASFNYGRILTEQGILSFNSNTYDITYSVKAVSTHGDTLNLSKTESGTYSLRSVTKLSGGIIHGRGGWIDFKPSGEASWTSKFWVYNSITGYAPTGVWILELLSIPEADGSLHLKWVKS